MRNNVEGGEPRVLKEVSLKTISKKEGEAAKLEVPFILPALLGACIPLPLAYVHAPIPQVDVLRRINHPHICAFFSHWDDPSAVAIVMEYAAGGDLARLIERRVTGNAARLLPGQIATYAIQVLRGIFQPNLSDLSMTFA